MKIKNNIFSRLTVAFATVSLFFAACDDDVSNIGDSITSTEVAIHVDSLSYNLKASVIQAPIFESRSSYTLVGSIDIPEYGKLDCSYVTQFLPTENLNLPDTINADKIDSVKMILTVPKRYITGDTLAPQQLKTFALTKQLPADISYNFRPDGYYEPSSPLGVENYTLAGYTYGDSTFIQSSAIEVKTKLPVALGRELVKKYSSDPDMFVWPDRFAQYFPGVYVTPSFGKGCVAPVSSTTVYAYFPYTKTTSDIDSEGNATIKNEVAADSICLMTTAPEVLSSVNIDYEPSDYLKNMVADGRSIITTPGGYAVSFEFPTKAILQDYWNKEYDLGVINNMKFSIPAKVVNNSYGIGLPPALLLVKTSEMDSFFAEGRLPDNLTSFTSVYSSDNQCYTFSGMRQYIVNMKEKGEASITADDVEFSLIPVTVSTEDYTDSSTGQQLTAVTSITPYIIMPTMVELDTEHAEIVFTYSNQTIQ